MVVPPVGRRTMNRRRILGSLAACAIVPGCLSRGSSGGDRDSGFYDVSEYAPGLAAGDLPREEHAVVVHLRSAAEADRAFATESSSDEARTAVEEFVEETPFEEATLFYVETHAPNTCYGVRVESLELGDDGVLRGRVAAKDVSGPNEGCASVLTTPALLLRVRGDPDPPTGAELDVTNGRGDTEPIASVSPEEYDPGSNE